MFQWRKKAAFFEHEFYKLKHEHDRNLSLLQLRNQQIARKDSVYMNFKTGQGTPSDVSFYTNINTFTIYSWQTLEQLAACDPIIKKILRIITENLYKSKFQILSKENPTYTQEFYKLWRDYGLPQLMKSASRAGYVFGSAFLLLDTDDSNDEAMPFDMKKVTRINNIEMINRYFLAAEPVERDFNFNPVYYYLVQQPIYNGFDMHSDAGLEAFNELVQKLARQKIHYTRMLPFHGNRLDPYLFRTNLHFHDTYIRSIQGAAQGYHTAMDNITTLISRIPMPISKIKNLTNMMMNPQQVSKLAQMMSAREQYRSTNNNTLLDTEEDYSLYSPALAGLAELIQKAMERLCVESEIPHDLLFGEGSQGTTSGRTEKSNFDRFIESEQVSQIQPKIEFFMKLFEQVHRLKVPSDFEIEFEHTERQTELEKSQTLLNTASATAALTEQGFDCTEYVEANYPQIRRDQDFSNMLNGELNE
jgi:uncharacterized protein